MDANDKLNGQRNFVRKTVTLIPLGPLTACEQRTTTQTGAMSCSEGDQAQTPSSETPCRPRFFDAGEWCFLEAAFGRLIPADAHGPWVVDSASWSSSTGRWIRSMGMARCGTCRRSLLWAFPNWSINRNSCRGASIALALGQSMNTACMNAASALPICRLRRDEVLFRTAELSVRV